MDWWSIIRTRNAESPKRLYALHKEAYGVSRGFRVPLHGNTVGVEHEELHPVLFTHFRCRLESRPRPVADGAHVKKVLRRLLDTSTPAELIDTPCLLFGVKLEVQVENRASLNAPSQPITRVSRDRQSERQSEQALGYTTVSVKQCYVGFEYETLKHIAPRAGRLHVRQFDQFRLPSPSLTLIEGRGRGRWLMVTVSGQCGSRCGSVGFGQTSQRLLYGSAAIIRPSGPLLSAQRRTSKESVELVRVLCVERHDAYERLVRPAIVALVSTNISEVIEALELRGVAGFAAQLTNRLVREYEVLMLPMTVRRGRGLRGADMLGVELL